VTASESSVLPRFFRSRAMVWLGQYSYGLYVFHHFVSFFYARHHTEEWLTGIVGNHLLAVLLQSAAGVGVSILVSLASFRYFESRFLAMKRTYATKGAPAH